MKIGRPQTAVRNLCLIIKLQAVLANEIVKQVTGIRGIVIDRNYSIAVLAGKRV